MEKSLCLLTTINTDKIAGKVLHGIGGYMVHESREVAVAIVTSRGSRNAIPPGRLTYVTKETPLILLCSRDASVLDSCRFAIRLVIRAQHIMILKRK